MKTRSLVRWFSKFIAVAALLLAGTAQAADIHAMISAGFYEAYSELRPAFEKSTGHRLITTRGPSLGNSPEAIPNRLKRNEPTDVVIMVGASIDDLTRQGSVRAGTKVDLARSEIGMVVKAGAAKPDISTVDALRRTLLDAKSIAYSDSASGIYLSTTLFTRLGVKEQVSPKSRMIKGPPSGENVADVVGRGEAEIGFQQVSELIHVKGITFVGRIPAQLQQDTFFSAALANSVRNQEAAEALIRYLSSPEAAPTISKAGLTPTSRQ